MSDPEDLARAGSRRALAEAEMSSDTSPSAPYEDQTAIVPTVADAVAAGIEAAAIRVVFTFPGGGSNLALLESLQARGILTILTRSEAGGAFMAAAVADVSGTPGVLIVGLGPGAASAVNGAAHALLDRSPLLIIADRYSEADAATTGHQLIEQGAMLAPVVKARAETVADDVAETVARALAITLDAPRGPVLLEMPRDSARMPAWDFDRVEPTHRRPEADGLKGDVSAVSSVLDSALRPILLIGEEARRILDPSLLVQLAERFEAPVLTTYKAKGAFPESHRLAAGILTGAEIERPLLTEADVMVAIGLDPVELLARSWPYEAQMVAVRHAADLGRYLPVHWELIGNLDVGLRRLLAVIDRPSSQWDPSDAVQRGAYMRDQLRTGTHILPIWRVVEVAQELLGDPVVTVDAGVHMFGVTWFWRSERPNRFHISNGLGTMGFALPAAIGLAIASPSESVLAFTGDGGFTINAGELETAARCGAKVIVLVLNDASLSLIRVKQADVGLSRSNVDFVRSDLARVAEGLGARGARAASEPELRQALLDALAAPLTTVIDVAIDGTEHADLHRRIRGAS
jgi:acetolactate synthase I/II/III large subunit